MLIRQYSHFVAPFLSLAADTSYSNQTNKMQLLKQRFLPALVVGFTFFSSCKKTDVAPPPTEQVPLPGVLSADMKDSALIYSRDIYLWYNQIPAGFSARSYDDPNKIMNAIRQYSIEPGFSTPVDRWSFAVNQGEWNNVSSGISGDFGLTVFFRSEGDLRVRLVEPASPAGKAGVRRGWRITSINGNSNISTSNADFIIKNVYQSSSNSFTFQKPDNSTVTVNLAATSYQDNPIVLDSVYRIDSKKIGYFSFNSFLGDTTKIYNEFNRIFNRFAAEGVNDVVIDLRYNGGGYVSVAQKLGNWLAPLSANGNRMMNEEFNDKYSRYNDAVNFRKLGSLNLDRIFFIVSNGTASASELLINNLKPYMSVNIVGSSKTYGKPVGYFPIPLGEWYIFPVSFRSTNKNGEGAYFNGISLNHQAADGLDKDWGDINESLLNSTVGYIVSGVYRSSAAGTRILASQQSAEVKEGNNTLQEPFFKGAVDTRRLR
jgi:C-terminal processing protease CtpA/Prc